MRGVIFLRIPPMAILALVLATAVPAEAQETAVPDAADARHAVLELLTEPDDAEIYLNHRYYGRTPLRIEDLDPGSYLLTVRKQGHYDTTRWIDLRPGARLTLEMDLEPITGYLLVDAAPPDAEIRADGMLLDEGIAELPVGEYLLRVTAFGFREYRERIAVREDRTTRVRVVLERAPFDLSGLSTNRKVFNPRNPGAHSRVTISFEASGPGSGEAVISGPDGTTVFRRVFPSFRARRQSFVWDGTGAGGEPLSDGEYRITVSGSGTGESAVLRESVAVAIDSTREVRYRNPGAGISGSIFAGSAEVLPEGSLQAGSLFLYPLTTGDETDDLSRGAVVGAGGRYAPFANVEVDLAAHLFLRGRDGIDGSAGIGAKILLFRAEAGGPGRPADADMAPGIPRSFEVAASLRGVFSSRDTVEALAATAGGYAGLPVTVRYGIFRLLFHPEIGLSPYDPAESPYRKGAFVRGYLRGGLLLDTGLLSTGLSAAASTAPFGEGASFLLPVHLGWELHWVIPDTLLTVTVASVVSAGEEDPVFSAGAGFGIVY